MKWFVLTTAIIQGVWLLFDGLRAWLKGDYLTPSSGPRAGQLGPWATLISRLGINPRGSFMKSVHVWLGFAWLAAVMTYVSAPSTGRLLLIGCAGATLWYVPIGTIISLVLLGLLLKL